MLAQQVDVPEAVGQQTAAPISPATNSQEDLAINSLCLLGTGHGVRHRSGCNQLDRWIHSSHGLGEQIVFHFKLFNGHKAELPLAPRFVTDSPEPDPVRIGMTICCTNPSHGGRSCAVRVFDKLGGGPGIPEAGIYRHVGFDIQQPTKRHEFIRPHIIRLHRVPDRIHDRRALVRIANGIAPFVSRYEVASRPAVDSGTQLLQGRDHFRTKSFYVVGGHQRDCAYTEKARTRSGNLNACLIAVACASKRSGNFTYSWPSLPTVMLWRSPEASPQTRVTITVSLPAPARTTRPV